MDNLKNLLLMATAFLVLFGVAEVLYRWRKVPAESTRKLVHVGTGVLALLFPVVLSNHWQVLLLCGSFAALLLVSQQYNWLPSINRIRRESYGSLGYPVAVYGCFLVYSYVGKQYVYYYLPVMVLAVCDPVAAYVGRRTRYRPYRVGKGIKTLGGSLAFFVSAILVTAGVYGYLGTFPGMGQFTATAFLVALCATLAEAWSKQGIDNVTIPAAALFGLWMMERLNI